MVNIAFYILIPKVLVDLEGAPFDPFSAEWGNVVCANIA